MIFVLYRKIKLRNMKQTFYIIILFLFIRVFSFAEEVNEYQLHEQILNLKEASSPRIWSDYIIFTYKPEKPARYVGIAFSHEQFSEIHVYQKNSYGVYFYILPIPEVRDISYRIVVDGLWFEDPLSPQRDSGRNGVSLSRLSIPDDIHTVKKSPVIKSGYQAEFKVVLPRGKYVSLAGDFNNWDPYMMRMKEEPLSSTKSVYTLTLNLVPGIHHYYFIIDGEKTLDTGNPQTTYSKFGEQVSYFYIASSPE